MPWPKSKTQCSTHDLVATFIPAKHGNSLKCEKVEGLTADEYTLLQEDARNAEGPITTGAYIQ